MLRDLPLTDAVKELSSWPCNPVSITHHHKFDHIHAALSTLDLAQKRLPASEFFGRLNLRQSAITTRRAKGGDQLPAEVAEDCF